MRNILNNIMNFFRKPNKPHVNLDELQFLFKTPLQFPTKRWPEFLFKRHNEKVEAIRIIFNGFNYSKFYAASKNITSFQQQEGNYETKDIVTWLQIEQDEVARLRQSLELYKSNHYPNSLGSFLTTVNVYIQSLENMISTQRGHHKTALYLEEGVRTVLHEVESLLNNIFSYLDDDSIKEMPNKLESMRSTLLLISNEINFTEFHSWHEKLVSTCNLLEQIALGKPNYSYSETKQLLRPWFVGFSQNELFLEQCVRQLFTHFVVPQIKSTSDKRLTLIRQFHPYWAEAITDRLMKETPLENHSLFNIPLAKNIDPTKTSSISKFCFWRTPCKDENQFMKNAQLKESGLENNDLSRQAVYLH